MAITVGSLIGGAILFYSIAWALFVITAGWVLYVKASQPGWAILIPIYNTYVFLLILGRPWWWLLLYMVPVVGVVIGIIHAIDFARVFGRSPLFGIGIVFLSPIFLPILAFGDARYVGEAQGSWVNIS